jgi:hypothetical protein
MSLNLSIFMETLYSRAILHSIHMGHTGSIYLCNAGMCAQASITDLIGATYQSVRSVMDVI